MPDRFAHCGYCGAAFAADAAWPGLCGCGQFTYRTPALVALVIVPVEGGLLAVRRAIEPRRGELGLPGGYVTLGETWQQAAARELFEETGLAIDPAEVRDFRALSGTGTVMICGVARPRRRADLPPFVPNEEVSEL